MLTMINHCFFTISLPQFRYTISHFSPDEVYSIDKIGFFLQAKMQQCTHLACTVVTRREGPSAESHSFNSLLVRISMNIWIYLQTFAISLELLLTSASSSKSPISCSSWADRYDPSLPIAPIYNSRWWYHSILILIRSAKWSANRSTWFWSTSN